MTDDMSKWRTVVRTDAVQLTAPLVTISDDGWVVLQRTDQGRIKRREYVYRSAGGSLLGHEEWSEWMIFADDPSSISYPAHMISAVISP